MGEFILSSKPRINRYDEYIKLRIKKFLKERSEEGHLPSEEDIVELKKDLSSYIRYINEYKKSKEGLESLYRYMEYIMMVLSNSYNEMYEFASIFKSFIDMIKPELEDGVQSI